MQTVPVSRCLLASLTRFGAALFTTALFVIAPASSASAQVDRQPMTFDDVASIDELTAAHADLLRLYWAFFDREPDVEGALYWLEQFERCRSTESIVGWFGGGAEFQRTYEGVDDGEFITRMYANVLDRAPDHEGEVYWLDLLQSGQLSRPLAMLYFAASEEFSAAHPLPSDTVPSRRCRLATAGASAPRSVQLLTPAPISIAGDVVITAPSVSVEWIGFHESNNDAARQQQALDTPITTSVMESRNRDNPSSGSADVAVNPMLPITSPVSGTIIRAGGYTLYCGYVDDYVVIEPDSHPGWEVKVLHIDGVQVGQGDRVHAGVTVLAPRARVLPFRSQIDDLTANPSWPHVHIEVVDPSIPDRPSTGGGC